MEYQIRQRRRTWHIMSTASKFLNIRPRLRKKILDFVIASDVTKDYDLVYINGTISPLPAIAGVCRQLRAEILPLFFQHKTILFDTLGEMGAALLLAPSTIPYWQNIQVDCVGRRTYMGETYEQEYWSPDPGLEMLVMIPSLYSLCVDTDTIVLKEDTSIGKEVISISEQIKNAIPPASTLTRLEITGTVDGTPLVNEESDESFELLRKFKRTFRRGRDGHWYVANSLVKSLLEESEHLDTATWEMKAEAESPNPDGREVPKTNEVLELPRRPRDSGIGEREDIVVHCTFDGE